MRTIVIARRVVNVPGASAASANWRVERVASAAKIARRTKRGAIAELRNRFNALRV